MEVRPGCLKGNIAHTEALRRVETTLSEYNKLKLNMDKKVIVFVFHLKFAENVSVTVAELNIKLSSCVKRPWWFLGFETLRNKSTLSVDLALHSYGKSITSKT